MCLLFKSYTNGFSRLFCKRTELPEVTIQHLQQVCKFTTFSFHFDTTTKCIADWILISTKRVPVLNGSEN